MHLLKQASKYHEHSSRYLEPLFGEDCILLLAFGWSFFLSNIF